MSIPIIIPELGESVTEATIICWQKREGDRVQVGDVLLELETEKVNLDIGAEQAGVLGSILKQDGEDVAVGETIGTIEESSDTTDNIEKTSETKEKQPASSEEKPRSQPVKAPPIHDKKGVAAPQIEMPPMDASKPNKPPVGPKAEAEQPVKADSVKEHEEFKSTAREERPVPRRGERNETRRRMSRRRQTIARRLVEAQHTAAMLTTISEADMSEIMGLRRRVRESFIEQHGVNVGIVSFFVKAVTGAMRGFPDLNSGIDGDEIVTRHYYDISIAMDAEGGLVVPVLRDADSLSIRQIDRDIREFDRKIREGELALEDLLGGCFTISNGGVFGSLLSTPILNPPQVGILGLHRIEDRPVVVDGQVVIRPMMYLALSYDHRLVDGRQAVQFLARVKESIEDPLRMWLEE